MLLELAAANAAFAIVKTALKNTGDILNAPEALAQFFDSKSSLKKTINKKGGNKSDLEEWVALQVIEKLEQEFKTYLIYQGEAGQWDSWLQFQAEAKRKKDAAEKADAHARMKRRQKIWGVVNGIIIALSVATGFFVVGLLIWAIYTKGQF